MHRESKMSAEGITYEYYYDHNNESFLSYHRCNQIYEVLFIVSGRGKIVFEGAVLDITPGMMLITKPLDYYFVCADISVPFERYVLNFPIYLLPEHALLQLLEIISVNGGVASKYYPEGTIPEEAYSLFDRFEYAASLPTPRDAKYALMLICEIFMYLASFKCSEIINNRDELGARVIEYLTENVYRNINLDHIAGRFFVSKYHLCRAFKKHNGISVHNYINLKRVLFAKNLIASGSTASAAADRVGFGDYSSFYRAYLRIIGKAPTAGEGVHRGI